MPVSPNPVGSGARAAGMADAFVAVADDATAASWNPAGLVQLERPEISIVGSFNAISEHFRASPADPEFFSTHTDNNLDINFMSFVYPLPWLVGEKNATVSLNYQQKFDLSRNFNANIFDMLQFPAGTLNSRSNFDFNQSGSLSTITPAFAIELTQRLSVGVAVNFWRDTPIADNGWKQDFRISSETQLNNNPTVFTNRDTHEDYENFSGENFVAGILWSVTDKWNLGLRYDSAFTADVDYHLLETNSQAATIEIFENREMSLPDTWAFGAAYRANDKLTISMDISITDWNDFFIRREDGSRFSLVDASDPDDPAVATDYKRTKTIRLGMEYVFLPSQLEEDLPSLWTLRSGLFYDEEPASGRSTTNLMSRGDGKPDRFYGFTAGVGLLAFQRINIDAAYQLRYGNGVNSDFIRGVPGFEEDVLQHRVLLSTVIYF